MTFKVIAYYNSEIKITFEQGSPKKEEIEFYDYAHAKQFVNRLKGDWVYRRYRFHIVQEHGELIPPSLSIEPTKALICQ